MFLDMWRDRHKRGRGFEADSVVMPGVRFIESTLHIPVTVVDAVRDTEHLFEIRILKNGPDCTGRRGRVNFISFENRARAP